MNSVDKIKFSCLCTCHVIYGYCLLVKECIHLGSNVHPKVEQPCRRYPIDRGKGIFIRVFNLKYHRSQSYYHQHKRCLAEIKVSLSGFSIILNTIVVNVIIIT